MPNPFALIKRLDDNDVDELPTFTIVGGARQVVLQETVELMVNKKKQKAEQKGAELRHVTGAVLKGNGKSGTVLATVTRDQIDKFASYTGSEWFTTAGTYRRIKSLPEWKAVYGVKMEPYPYVDTQTGQETPKPIDVVFCRECGVKMPLQMATLDHQQPQSTGANYALCRFFRSLGLTVGAGTGRKTTDFHQRHAASVGGLPGTNDAAARYTLNPVGRIYYSLLVFRNDWTREMADRCLHSIFNLRPVCLPCNSSIGNSNSGWF